MSSSASKTDEALPVGVLYAIENELTERSKKNGLRFQPNSDDVILVTIPKSGTACVLQILQSLRSRGDMSFEDINITATNIEAALDYGIDLAAPQTYKPRAFWTHLPRANVPKGARYIYLVRDPLDSGPSMFFYLQGWYFEPGQVSLDTYLKGFTLRLGEPTPGEDPMWYNTSTWHHMASWYPHRADPDVLWLHYEDLHADRAACVKLIAEFCGLGHDEPQLQALAHEQSDIAFMQQFPEKYDDHVGKEERNLNSGVPANAGMSIKGGRVREGKMGQNKKALSPEMIKAFQQKWLEVMLPATGFSSYQDMRSAINRELGRPFK